MTSNRLWLVMLLVNHGWQWRNATHRISPINHWNSIVVALHHHWHELPSMQGWFGFCATCISNPCLQYVAISQLEKWFNGSQYLIRRRLIYWICDMRDLHWHVNLKSILGQQLFRTHLFQYAMCQYEPTITRVVVRIPTVRLVCSFVGCDSRDVNSQATRAYQGPWPAAILPVCLQRLML